MIHTDPLIAEIRLVRQAISAEFNHDPKQMYNYYQRVEQELKNTGKYTLGEAEGGKFISTESSSASTTMSELKS